MEGTTIILPFPPAVFSGHNTGHWAKKSGLVKKHREWARNAALAAKPAVPGEGDIPLRVRFFPPNARGDRVNFPNRMKPLLDGIADALKVNDARFVPSYELHPPEKPGRVEIEFAPLGEVA